MTWNHRLVKRTYPTHYLGKGKKRIKINEYTDYGVHEVYYERGEPFECTVNPKPLVADTLEDLIEIYAWMGDAFKKPVLDYDRIGKKKKKKKAPK